MTLILGHFFVRMCYMVLAKLNSLQIIFLILVPIFLILAIVLLIVIPVNNRHHKNNFNEYCYKAIYKIAFDEDYYLINNFVFRVDHSRVARIDHILFANKYIYVIIDTYYDGSLVGKDEDKSLILIDKKNTKYYTDNQFLVSKSLVNSLSRSTGIDKDLFIGIVVVNNSCKLGIETNEKSNYMIQRNKLKKLIKAIESRDVGNINSAQLESAVKAIDKLNRTKRKNEK